MFNVYTLGNLLVLAMKFSVLSLYLKTVIKLTNEIGLM